MVVTDSSTDGPLFLKGESEGIGETDGQDPRTVK